MKINKIWHDMSRRKKVIIVLASLIFVILIVAAVWWAADGRMSGGTKGQAKDSSQVAEQNGGENEDDEGNTAGDGESENSENGAQGGGSDGSGAGTVSDEAADSGEVNGVEMTLPYTVPGTGLVIDRIDSYSGVFIEDGTDEEVTDIFAVHVQNQSDNNVEYSNIILEINGKPLNFKITDLPAGSGITVLESSRAAWEDGTPGYVDNQTAYIDAFDMLNSDTGVVIGDDNGITVTNLTDEEIPCLRLFYKFVKDGEYLGGITYTAKIDNLAAGDSVTIYPSHFAKDGSQVMMVRRYESTE